MIFSSLAETQSYEKYPVILSSLAHEENYATKAYSENIQLQLCDLFSFGRNSFEKLIEIQFSVELDFSRVDYDRHGSPVHRELFANIGKSCPNLQKLDLGNSFFVPYSVFIHLIFRDVEESLNKNNDDDVIHISNISESEAEYYGVNVETYVCPDLLYDRMAKKARVNNSNVIKISDLVNCVPAASDNVGRRRELNDLWDSLRVLHIGSRHKMGDHDLMLPFLLKTFPKLVSLNGTENIALGFQQLKDFTNDDSNIEPFLLQHLCYYAHQTNREEHWEKRLRRDISYFHDWIHNTGKEDIIKEAAEILHNIEKSEGIGSYEHLKQFVSTVSEMCPKATDILFYLPNRHNRKLNDVWWPLKNLFLLKGISVHGSNFEDISFLLRNVPELFCFEIYYNTQDEEEYQPACVDEFLTLCSKIKLLKWKEGTGKRSTLSSSVVERTYLSTIQELTLNLNISKDAFFWIWNNASEFFLSFHVSFITLASARNDQFNLTESFDHQEMFYKSDIVRMFESNPMKYLQHFSAGICLPNIATARYFVDMFRKQKIHPNEISMLHIKIELMESELVLETLEKVGREMKSFEQYCKELKKEQPATYVGYSFTRIGGVRNYIDWIGNIRPAGNWEY